MEARPLFSVLVCSKVVLLEEDLDFFSYGGKNTPSALLHNAACCDEGACSASRSLTEQTLLQKRPNVNVNVKKQNVDVFFKKKTCCKNDLTQT
jgi:hypothetical protein